MARHRNLTVPAVNTLLVSGRGCVMSYMVYNSGTAATVHTLTDGYDDTGQSLAAVYLTAGTSSINQAWPRGGLCFEQGLYSSFSATPTIAGAIAVILCDSAAEWQALISSLGASTQ